MITVIEKEFNQICYKLKIEQSKVTSYILMVYRILFNIV